MRQKDDDWGAGFRRFAFHAAALALITTGVADLLGRYRNWEVGPVGIFVLVFPLSFVILGGFNLWRIGSGQRTLREWLDDRKERR